MMKFLLFVLFNCFLSFTTFAIDVKTPAIQVGFRGHNPEAPSVTPDGLDFAYLGAPFASKFSLPSNIYFSDESKLSKRARFLNIFAQVEFIDSERLMVSELGYRPFSIVKTLYHVMRGEDVHPYGYVSKIRIMNRNGKILRSFKPSDFGIQDRKAFLQHPRLSPDEQWLVFYLKGSPEVQGTYLAYIADGNKKIVTHHLSKGSLDRHPIFDQTSQKILFHYQLKLPKDKSDDVDEESVIGCFQLNLNKNKLVSYDRVLLEPGNSAKEIDDSGYFYQKHPTLYPGTDLVFFHGQTEPEGKKKLMVRRLEKNSRIYSLDIRDEAGVELKKAKHPSSHHHPDSGLTFIGKRKGSDVDQVFHLPYSAIQEIQSKLD